MVDASCAALLIVETAVSVGDMELSAWAFKAQQKQKNNELHCLNSADRRSSDVCVQLECIQFIDWSKGCEF